MAGNKKGQRLMDISSMLVKVMLFSMLFFVAVLSIYMGVSGEMDSIKAEPVRYLERWNVVDMDGSVYSTGRSYRTDKDLEKDFTIYTKLPDDVKDNEFLCFQVGKNVAVYVNGELRKDYIESRDVVILGGNVKRFYMLVPLYSTDAGGEVKMIRESTVKNGLVVPETFISTYGGCYNYMLLNYGFTFIMAVIVFVFSIVVFVVSIGMAHWYKRKINMMYGALGIMIISAWLITDSFLFPFVFGKYFLDGVINYMLCLMIPFGPVLYLNAIQKGRYQKSMSALMIISSCNALLWTALHFTGIVPFDIALTYITIVLASLAVAAIVILVVDSKKGNTADYKYTVIGFMGFLIFSIVEISFLLFFVIRNETLPMIIGLEVFLIFVVIQQVDDLRKVFAEKQHAIDLSEAKSKFLASMSHEIRTPINAVIGMNEMILREAKDPTILSYAGDIKSASRTLLTLINGVLDLSKIESGKMEIVPAKYETAEVVDDLVNMTADRASQKGLMLKLDIDEKLPKGLYGDDVKIRQVILNLLTNAVKYTEKGTITLTLRGENVTKDDCTLFVEVKDTGIGIKEEDMEKLFQSFQRLDENRNRTIEGTGLGMSIVDGMLKLMNSRLEIKSKYGEGSSFSFRIHQEVSDATPMGTYHKHRKEEAEKAPKKTLKVLQADVLIVDDNELNLKVAAALMKKMNVFPDLANSGQQSIEMARKKHYDIIFMDHMMPEMDGIEALEILKKEKLLEGGTVVIALTANAISGARETYLAAGFQDYLSKPMIPPELEKMMETYLPDGSYTFEG